MTRALRVLLATVALALQGFGARPAAAPRATTPASVVCTFENPSYAGACVEKTTRDAKQTPAAACQPILDCLNNPMCSKTYCRATAIRQGWTLKSAE
jgi:hypothetical protein